ncbi:restriction endonuclease [Paenibacillus sp. FSL E2-0190]|uniref:restriction endonuclease n=1 Tax=Paenibacillus sp. FSL E2-0190 TaxID=2954504 RepID=UPI0030ED71DE
MKHKPDLYSIATSELEFSEWRNYILSDSFQLLDNSRCFPSDDFADIFIERADDFNEIQVKTLLRRFLVRSGESVRDTSKLPFYQSAITNKSTKRGLDSEYVRRLTSDDDFAWEGLSWVIDLLPDNPKMAINVINAYELAHLLVLSDYDIYGLNDATLIIRKMFIDISQPRETLLNLTPREFELLVDALYEKMGYETILTKITRDGGLDIIATSTELGKSEKIIVECKRHFPDISPDYIRSLYGVVHSEKATKGVLVATSNFSLESKRFAEKNGIELINHDDLVKLLNLYLGSNWVAYLDRIIQLRRLYHLHT